MFAFAESADREAWRTGGQKPAVVLILQGQPKLKDVTILAQGLLPGQTLRVVSESRSIQPELEALCISQGLRIVATNEDRVLVFSGCYAHHYFDIQLTQDSAPSPAEPPTSY